MLTLRRCHEIIESGNRLTEKAEDKLRLQVKYSQKKFNKYKNPKYAVKIREIELMLKEDLYL